MRKFGNLKLTSTKDGPVFLLKGRPIHDGDLVMYKVDTFDFEEPPFWAPGWFEWSGSDEAGPSVLVRIFGHYNVHPDSQLAWPPPNVVEHLRLRDERREANFLVRELTESGASEREIRAAQAALDAKEKELVASLKKGAEVEGEAVELGVVLLQKKPEPQARTRRTRRRSTTTTGGKIYQ